MEFLTEEDRERLVSQLDELKGRRKGITERIAEARAHGDLKENAEYHAAREDQGMNEAKIRQIEEKLDNSQVVDRESLPQDMVFVGSTVKLRDVKSGNEMLYRVVGEASGNFSEDFIEVTAGSPMGEALVSSRIGETIRVDLPRGTKRFEIISFAD